MVIRLKKQNYMTSEEAAKLVGVTENTLRHMRSREEGPPYRRFNGRILYLEKEVNQWMDKQLKTPINK